MFEILFINFIILITGFVLLWLLGTALRNVSIVDIAWGPACALPGVCTWFMTDNSNLRATLLAVFVAIWALRLGVYLAIRNIGHGEDFRYVRMRKKVGPTFVWTSLFYVFILQCCIAFVVSLPVQVGQFGTSGLFAPDSGIGLVAFVGIGLYLVGLVFETVGDIQLRAFKKDPANKGKLMDRGLWAWTRHPNYFGDAAVWVGLSLIALESQYGFAVLFSPAVMVFCLYQFSGKALLERTLVKKYPDYADYKARVSGFLPMFPRSGKSDS